MTQRKGPRLVNPGESSSSADNKIPWKTIMLTAMLTGAATTLGVKLLEYSLEKGKQLNPFAKKANPALPGQPQFQSPYSHLAQSQALPVQPMEMPRMPEEDVPPKWAQQFMQMHDQRLREIEQRLGPRIVDEDEDAA